MIYVIIIVVHKFRYSKKITDFIRLIIFLTLSFRILLLLSIKKN
jgi:hypothetical protein